MHFKHIAEQSVLAILFQKNFELNGIKSSLIDLVQVTALVGLHNEL